MVSSHDTGKLVCGLLADRFKASVRIQKFSDLYDKERCELTHNGCSYYKQIY